MLFILKEDLKKLAQSIVQLTDNHQLTIEEYMENEDGFFKKQTEDTVKAFISTKTKKVRRFIWFKERDGGLELSREACYNKAIEFL